MANTGPCSQVGFATWLQKSGGWGFNSHRGSKIFGFSRQNENCSFSAVDTGVHYQIPVG